MDPHRRAGQSPYFLRHVRYRGPLSPMRMLRHVRYGEHISTGLLHQYQTRCMVLPLPLCSRYAMSGTDVAYRATSFSGQSGA
eukprot:3119641-Rhodomonas_salina.3